jgi:hypothetical protein
MKEVFLQVVVFAYAIVGVIGLVGYWPTIKDLHFHKKASANLTSYLIWSLASGIGFLYSMVILPDLLLRLVSGLNFGACALILLLTINLKKG